ncbi:XRE family transcriptional regulator [Sphingobacteriales bacterium UPWRP_1]|nr:hypothetical protein BVG80_17360 [Sphingobacteriales bacterium TSM_CSM]PSJ74202.1 XRE family transcriptional regulator [Sphingobacteriales bacterium UPWRP_1]
MYFSKNIKHLRESANLSQEKLGELFSLADTTISNWEKGRSNPNIAVLVALCKHFDTDPTTLLYTDMSLEGVGVGLLGGEKAKPAANRVGDADGLKQCHEQVAALQREMALKDEIIALLKDKVKEDK